MRSQFTRRAPRVRGSFAVSLAAAAACASILAPGVGPAALAQVVWDPDGDPTNNTTGGTGGAGLWNLTSPFWADDATAPNVAWPNLATSTALFDGTAGAVQIAEPAVQANLLTFEVTGYTIGNNAVPANTLTLAGTTPGVTVTTAGHVATIDAVVAGGAGLRKQGAGTLVLTNANVFTGALAVTAGTVRATSNAGALGNGTLTLGGGTLELVNDTGLSFNRATTVSASSTITLDRVTTGAGVTHALGTLAIGGSQVLTIGRGASVDSGTAQLNFNGVTLSGPATINTGAGTLTTLGNAAADVALGANLLTIGGDGNTTVVDNTTGSGGITKNGAGLLRFTADPNHNGLTTINDGVVEFQHSGSTDFSMTIGADGTARVLTANDLGDAFTYTINGTLDLRASDTLGTITGSGLITNNAAGTGTATLATSPGSAQTFSGVIQNGPTAFIAFTKGGAGTQTLTGTNTYSGATAINTGQLAISGPNGALGNTAITVGDNNGADESLSFGAAGDVWTVGSTVNRLGDTGSVTLNGRVAMTYTGPAAGSSGFNEAFGTLTTGSGGNTLNLVPGTGAEVQLSPTTLARTANGTLLVRGDDLGGSGTGSTRLVVTGTGPTLVGGAGAAGTPNVSILPWVVGDTSGTGPGSSFVTHDAGTGLRTLAAGEYDATIAGPEAPLRNVSAAGGETVAATARINALRLTGTGTTTIAAGQRVIVNSGAVLFTGGGTVAGAAGTLDFGAAEGVVYVASSAATTASINSRVGGTNGLTFASTGNLGSTLVLGGDNTAIGSLIVNAGILRLGNPGAVNDDYPMTVLGRPATTFQLGGNSATVRDLQSGGGSLAIQNASATPAVLTTYLTAGRTVTTLMSDGAGGGSLGLVTSGGQTLTLNAAHTLSGPVEVRTGALQLSGNNTGSINNVTALTVGGATLQLRNTNGNVLATRISDGGTVTMLGGTFTFDHNAESNTSFSETDAGTLSLAAGGNVVNVDRAATGRTSTVTFDALNRTAGATLNFTSFAGDGAQVFDLGTTNQSRLVLTAAPTPDDGIVGGWATADSSLSTREFVKYVASGTVSVTPLAAADYVTTLASGNNATQNVKVTGPAALTASTQVNSLNVAQAAATAVDIGGGGNALRVESGGVIVSGAFNASVDNGTLTAGTGSGGELVVHNVPAVNTGVASTNSGDTITLANVDNGIPVVFGSAPTGLTAGVTYYAVNSNGTTFQVALTPGGTVVPITGDGTTATVSRLFATTVNATIADDGAGNPVSLTKAGGAVLALAGTNTYTGRTTVNGGILRIADDANLGAPPAAPAAGHLTLSNSSMLDLTGNVTLNGNRGIAVGVGSNVINIPSGTAGNGRTLTYNGAITGVGTTEGSLRFATNLAATTGVDAGEVVGNLSGLSLGGTLRVDAGTLTAGGASNAIGRSLQVGMEGAGSLTYNAAGGSLSIGKGINDVLELGVVTLDIGTNNAFPVSGTLNAGALGALTVKVDTIRLGIGNTNNVGRGFLTLAAESDVTAGTSILVSNSPGQGQDTAGASSTIAFGGGTNTVTTRTFTLGGFKGNGQATVAAGGTVELRGFGAGTLDLSIAANLGNTGTNGQAHLNMTGGTLRADLDRLAIGEKTGGGAGGAQGTLTLTGDDNVVSANSVTLGNLNGANAAGTQATAGTLHFGGGTFNVTGDVSLALFANNTNGTQTSAGTLNLTGGTFTVGGNVVTNNSTRATATVTLDGGALDMTGGNLSADAFNARSGTLRDVAQLFAGDGATAAALTKTAGAGTNTLTILGANGYTLGSTAAPSTVVSSGTLVVNGSLTSATNAVAVNTGTLTGEGSIAGPVAVGNGTGTADATIAPGNSIGTLTTGPATFNPDGVFALEFRSSDLAADLLATSGPLTLDLTDGPALSAADVGAVTPRAAGTAIPFLTYAGAWNGGLFDVGGTPIADNGNSFFVGSAEYQLDYDYNGNSVALIAVPEPASAGVLAAAAAAAGLLARRRRRGA